jgi:hypothetical protein
MFLTINSVGDLLLKLSRGYRVSSDGKTAFGSRVNADGGLIHNPWAAETLAAAANQ